MRNLEAKKLSERFLVLAGFAVIWLLLLILFAGALPEESLIDNAVAVICLYVNLVFSCNFFGWYIVAAIILVIKDKRGTLYSGERNFGYYMAYIFCWLVYALITVANIVLLVFILTQQFSVLGLVSVVVSLVHWFVALKSIFAYMKMHYEKKESKKENTAKEKNIDYGNVKKSWWLFKFLLLLGVPLLVFFIMDCIKHNTDDWFIIFEGAFYLLLPLITYPSIYSAQIGRWNRYCEGKIKKNVMRSYGIWWSLLVFLQVIPILILVVQFSAIGAVVTSYAILCAWLVGVFISAIFGQIAILKAL